MAIINFLNSPRVLDFIAKDRFLLIALVIILIRMKYASYRSLWVSALVNIPGTFLHELCHFIIGLITNATPTNFTIWPRQSSPSCYTMGSVSFNNITFYNAIPAAMAPLLLLPVGFFINQNLGILVKPNITNYVLYIFLQTLIIENAIPSSQDFRVAFSKPLGVILYATLGFFVWHMWVSGFFVKI